MEVQWFVDNNADGILAVTLFRDKRYVGYREDSERRQTRGKTNSFVKGDLEPAWLGEVRPQISLGV